MSLLDRIRYSQRRDAGGFRRFVVAGLPVGWVAHGLADRLRGFPAVFAVSDGTVRLIDTLDSFEGRSRAVGDAVHRLREEGWFPEEASIPAALARQARSVGAVAERPLLYVKCI